MSRFWRLAGLLFIAATLAFATPSYAATTAEVQVGKGGSAVGSLLHEDGCLQTEAVVIASEQMFKQGAGSPVVEAGGFLIIIRNDTCAGTQTAEFGNFENLDLKSNNVQSAQLIGDSVVSDFADPSAPPRPVAVDLTFTATETAEHGTSHFNVQFPGGQTVYHANGFFARGTVSGYVGPPSGDDNLVEGALGNATLDQHREGAVQIIRS